MNYGIINISGRAVSFNGNPIRLTNAETDYLLLLAQNAGETLSQSAILAALYGKGGALYNGGKVPHIKIVDVVICKIRRKIENVTGMASPINTVWNAGYNLPKATKAVKKAA